MLLCLIMLFRQCDKSQQLKYELEVSRHIANQNLAALNDNEIRLMVTKDQLKEIDYSLYEAKRIIDSLIDVKSQVITKTEVRYIEQNITLLSELYFDSIRGSYGLKFLDDNNFRKIEGISFFKVKEEDASVIIEADSTIITNLSFNFALVISQYQDNLTNYTRTKMLPFYVNIDGSLGGRIPNEILNIDFRNAEILDTPFTPNQPPIPIVTNNNRFNSGFAVTINPLAFGLHPTDNGYRFGWTPNIGIGYYITFRK